MQCTRSRTCVRIFLLASLSFRLGDRGRYHARAPHIAYPQINTLANSLYRNQMKRPETTQWWRFKKWLIFMVTICAMIFVIGALVKIPQYWSADDSHWLVGKMTVTNFVYIWLGFFLVVSPVVAGLCSFLTREPPDLFSARSGRK